MGCIFCVPGSVLAQGIQVTQRDPCPPVPLSPSYKLAFWAHKSSMARVPNRASHSAHRDGFRAGSMACWERALDVGKSTGSTAKQLCELGHIS